MNIQTLHSLAQATLKATMSFPEIVEKLLEEGVEYYHVDYVSLLFTFYDNRGTALNVPIQFEALPSISENFDLTALKLAILDSQQQGQKFRQFSERAVGAGVHGYFAFLKGKRVVYLGRQGDQHTECFPGVKK